MSYFKNISNATLTTLKGLGLSLKYFFDARKKRKKEWVADSNYFERAEGTFTVQYPHEKIPVPDHGRYQLHNEIDDCIVCDKCAKICPVDCIDIEPVRATGVYGQTSDGTSLRIHAAKFDIDMSKCFYCGLCTVVCPTECLTMTDEYDFSTTNILDHNFSFSKMTEKEIAEKKSELESFQKQKEQKSNVSSKPVAGVKKPVIVKPSIGKPKTGKPVLGAKKEAPVKPVLKPRPIPKKK
ncbi:MAG: 4Fe-4S dicluster domain-containing protein [Bacteroidota bacterium]